MSKTLSTHDLTESLRYEMGFTKAEAEDAVQFLLNQITEALIAGDDVWIRKYVRLRLVDRSAKDYLNMTTGEKSTMAPGKRIRVRFSPALLEKIDPGYGMKLDNDGNVYSVRDPGNSDDELDEMDELEELEGDVDD